MHNLLILHIILLSLLCHSAQASSGLSRPEAISYLVDLAALNQKKLVNIDQEIREVLMLSHNTNLTPKEGQSQLNIHTEQLEKLSLKRREHYLRQNFIDRLKFKIDKSYTNQEMKAFLSKSVLELAHEEALDVQGDIGFTRFCNFLSLAIKQIPERNENLLGFIEGYMKFSGVLNPISPTEYIHHRSYTNGMDSYNANSVSKENVGEIVEERLQQLKARDLLNRKAFEQRQPILKPVVASSYQPVILENTEAQAPSDAKAAAGQGPLQLRIQLKDVHNPDADQVDSPAPPKPLTKETNGYE